MSALKKAGGDLPSVSSKIRMMTGVKYYLVAFSYQRVRQHLFAMLLCLAVLVFIVTTLQASIFATSFYSRSPLLSAADSSSQLVVDGELEASSDVIVIANNNDPPDETNKNAKVQLENNFNPPSQATKRPKVLTTTKQTEDNYKFDDGKMENMFEDRQELATKTCLKYYNYGPNISFIPYREVSYRFIYVDDVHKILYCAVPKVASTNWKRMFMLLGANGNASVANVEMDEVHEGNATWPYIKPLKYYTPSEVAHRIQNYTKIMWVRNPLHRLVSAWRSKFTRNNTFYNEIYGSYIIKKYRPRATEAEIKAGYPVSLKEFFLYLRDEGLVRGDVHWGHYTSHCLSCIIPYDYIGKLEDMAYEATYVVRKTTGIKDFEFPLMSERKSGAPSFNDRDYMAAIKELPLDLLQYVAVEFKIDYEMFGYAMPRFFE